MHLPVSSLSEYNEIFLQFIPFSVREGDKAEYALGWASSC